MNKEERAAAGAGDVCPLSSLCILCPPGALSVIIAEKDGKVKYPIPEKLNHNMTGKSQRCKGHYGLVQLEGNMTRPIPGDSTKTSMVFWYDPKEEQKIHSDRL